MIQLILIFSSVRPVFVPEEAGVTKSDSTLKITFVTATDPNSADTIILELLLLLLLQLLVLAQYIKTVVLTNCVSAAPPQRVTRTQEPLH